MGGDVDSALPAAAAVEIYHNWTLVHDDIIDDDDTRRGASSSHVALRDALVEAERRSSRKIGADFAVLAGDIQHGWAVDALARCVETGASPETASRLTMELQRRVTVPLVSGEALDVFLSLGSWKDASVGDVERMMSLKTGALLGFCAYAGAVLALDNPDAADSDPRVEALSEFAKEAGLAFQIRDDILGVFGDGDTLGKPICSDLAESKPTTLLLDALEHLSAEDAGKLASLLGRRLDDAETAAARELFGKSGAVERAGKRAERLVESAKQRLDILHDGEYKLLLLAWADFMVAREC